jgi:hypothetical protein
LAARILRRSRIRQIAFFFIASDPVRYRPMMIPSMFEKFSFVVTVVVLVLQARTRSSDLVFAGTDLLLGVLFVIAYRKTPPRLP